MSYPRMFDKQNYESIKAQLLSYRLDPFIRAKESETGTDTGLIFPFARGLRFSALLIYTMREALSDSDLEVSWGQLIDDDGLACSGECDIIIHQRGHYKRWNGSDGGNHIMDFRFIEKKHAKTVISCKSYLTTSALETKYCESMLGYVPNVWLFSECCGPESMDLIKEESRKIGYSNFWTLYTWSRSTESVIDQLENWYDFMDTLRNMKSTPAIPT